MEDNDIPIKFRYTFENFSNKEASNSCINELSERLGISSAIYSSANIEHHDKMGKETKPHIHIHFVYRNEKGVKDVVGSLRKKLQRYFADSGETRKGNILYSLVEETDVKDLTRFLRYPLKQGDILGAFWKDRLCKYPSDFDISLQTSLAAEEYARMVEFKTKKHEESLKPSTKDKLFEYLDAIHSATPFKNKKSIGIAIVEYYSQEEKSLNVSTVQGYLHLATIRYKLVSIENWVEQYLCS